MMVWDELTRSDCCTIGYPKVSAHDWVSVCLVATAVQSRTERGYIAFLTYDYKIYENRSGVITTSNTQLQNVDYAVKRKQTT